MCEKKKTPHEVGLGGADNGTLQIGQLRTEEFLGILCLRNSPLYQKSSQDGANA